MSLTDLEQQALLWPIKAKDKVQRWNVLGDPAVEKYYHKAMEGGRWLEKNIADAQLHLTKAQQDLNQKILIYTHMNSLAVDGQLSDNPRVPKYVADSVSILLTARALSGELLALANACTQNIATLLAMEASMLMMVQTALNSIANLLNNICNWGIPALPSIPNLLADTVWNWNGFTFSPLALFAALGSNTHFNFNFSLSQCNLLSLDQNAFRSDPLTTQTYSGLSYGTTNYDPPLAGAAVPAAQDLTDPAFVSQMRSTTAVPYYSPSFNPNTDMQGAVPDPRSIISNYQMPAATYQADIVSIVPALRANTVEPSDPDYASPNTALRSPQLRKDLIHFVNLGNILQTGFDPLVASAWLLYLNLARQGRGGSWIPNFEAAYQQHIQPSLGVLQNVSVPWNDVLPGDANFFWAGAWAATAAYAVGDIVAFNGMSYAAAADNTNSEPDTSPADWATAPANTVYSNAPAIPLVATLQGLPLDQRNRLLWQLSYIEASLLGYTRNGAWDATQDAAYLAGATGSDLDYKPTAITAQTGSVVLGEGAAEFPVPITFPTAMTDALNQAIALATLDIQNDLAYVSPRLGNRFTYDQFAQAAQVDRFSQFWRDFATNLAHFLAQDPYLVQFAITYPLILNGALNPLGDQTSYNLLLQDVASRSRSWTPGTPLLPIPVAPIVSFQNNSAPDVNTNGWAGEADLNPAAFLARPDIQALPIPVQTAMLRTNLSYASLQKFKQEFQAAVAESVANANAVLQAAQQVSFITATSLTADVLTVTCQNSLTAGLSVLVSGTAEPFLNDLTFTVLPTGLSASQFEAVLPAPPTVITATSLAADVLTVTVANSFDAGQSVYLTGTAEAFLNGQTVTVLPTGLSASQFEANFTASPPPLDYSNPSDTGTAILNFANPSDVGTVAVQP